VKHVNHLLSLPAFFALVLTAAHGQDAGKPAEENLNLKPREAFSPYANRNFPTEVYWGDTHLHTGLSLDAGVFGNTLRPADAYRLARGEQITSSTGLPVKLGRPLAARRPST
jgi:hypothetical protein